MDLEAADAAALAIFFVAAVSCALLWRAGRRGAAFAVWTAAIIATCVPFFDLHAHAHWYKVSWIPFISPPVKPSDIAANILIYVPFGFLSRPRRLRVRVRRVAAGAAVLSFACELSQVFSHGRIPSSTDIASDVIGAAIGVAASALVENW